MLRGSSAPRSRAPAAHRGALTLSFSAVLAVLLGLIQPIAAYAAGSPQGDVAQPWPVAMNDYRLATGAIISDNNTDQNPSGDDLTSGTCVGSKCVGPMPTVLYYASGDTAFLRFRIGTDIRIATPSFGGTNGGAYLVQLAVHDYGTNTDTVRAVIGFDGKENASGGGDYVYVTDAPGNTVTKIYVNPWNNTGIDSRGFRMVDAADGSGNWFLDIQVPISRITAVSGGLITATTPIKMYYGTSEAANLATINKDYMLGDVGVVDFSGLAIVTLTPASLTLSSSATTASGPNPPQETVTSTYNVSMTATNPGGGDLTSTSVSIPLPAGVTASSITPSQGSVTGGPGGTLTWNLQPNPLVDPPLLPGHNATVTFVASVTPALGTAGTTQTLVSLQSGSGSDLPAAATRTATAAAITVGVIAAAPTWTFSFNSEGGTPTPTSQTVANNGHATAPADPTRTGYTFNGWYTLATGGTPWVFGTNTVTANTTVHAQWTPINYTLSFNSQGGSAVGSQSVAYGGHGTAPSDPTRTGYTFNGWYTLASGGSQWNFGSDTITADRTLYAQWTPINYTVTFDSHGGSAVGSQSIAYGGLVTQPSDPTRTGYTFNGWYILASGGSQWNFGSDTITSDRTLHAQWTPINYTVTFDSHGGSAVGSQSIAYGGLVTQPSDPTRTGYTFNGWYTLASGGSQWNFGSDTITSSRTLHAQWTPINYTVTFDSHGGSAVGSQTVVYGGLVTQPSDPTRTGYTFNGWYTLASGGSQWNFGSDTITSDRTLHAQWTPIDYTVTFDSHGGSAVGSQTVTYGGTATEPASPTRTGYTFNGWFDSAVGGSAWNFATHAITGNTTIHAQWTINTYTVTFDSQGGSAVGPQSVAYGDFASAPSDPSMTGHTFGGWFDSAVGGSAWIFAGHAITGNTTIYAHWTTNTYPVTFDSQGGSAVGSQSIAYGDYASAPADPTFTGYTFNGWFTASSGGSMWSFTTAPILGATTLYAQWTPIDYTVTFDSHGGSAVGSQTVAYGGLVTQPSDPSRTGYTFNGWYTLASGGSLWNFGINTVTGDRTLHAQWTPINYSVSFDSQGGTTVAGQTVAYGGLVSEPSDPTQTGQTFNGWFTAPSGGSSWNFSLDTVTSATTLYAQWTSIDYTVTFDSHGGSAVGSQTVAYGGTVTEPTPPTLVGHTFDGWYTLSSGGTQWNFPVDTITADVTLHAQWTPIDYTVTFDSQGGSAVGSQSVAYGTGATEPSTPTLTGYTFDGWFTASTGGAMWDFGADMVSGDTTLYAQWTVIDYTVAFDTQGGTSVASQTVAYGGVALEPSAPTLTGYSFDGWFDSAVGGSVWNFATHTITGGTTIYAQWTVDSYPVTFDSQGGSAVGSQTVDYGGFASAPADPVLAGNTFNGWFTASSGGSQWDFPTDQILGATTLYAQWTPIDYTVTFDSQGGSAVGSQSVAYDTYATAPPAPTRTGSTFSGWFTAPTGGSLWDFATDAVTGDTTLYARWAQDPQTVAFDSQGGTAVASQIVSYGDHASEPTDPTRYGFVFDGWHTSAVGGSLWGFATDPVNDSMTLYAQWTPVDYTVSFDSQGGSAVGDQTVSYGGLVFAPADPTFPGYTFLGWHTTATDGSVWDFATDTVTGDMTLYARWTPVDYTVTFDGQGGTPTPDATVAFGELVPQPSAPTWAGHTFTGWYTASSGGLLWDFGADTVSGDATLYAQWVLNTHTVTFDSQGGSFVPGETVAFGDHITEPTDPTRYGYTFDGWYDSGVGGSLWNFPVGTVSGDMFLYAQWTPVDYTVAFDSQGGSAVAPQTVPYAGTLTEPIDPTFAGYTFEGWFTSPSGGSLWDFPTDQVTFDDTLYAQWTPIDYAVKFDSQGGSAVSGETASFGSHALDPGASTLTGYQFEGWFTAPTGGSLWSFGSDTIAGDTTLYAQWEAIDYQVTFNSQGGTAVGGQTVPYGDRVTEPSEPTYTGYTFDGWFTTASGGSAWVFGLDTITGDTTLFAQWTVNDYTVTFDSQGGSAVGDQTVSYGGLASAPVDPTLTGYTFLGWHTTPSDGSVWNFASDTVTGDTTLYAQWAAIDYSVTFDSQGGSAVSAETVSFGSHALDPGAPSYAGHSFDGWFDSAVGGSAWDFGADTVTGDTALYAHWTVIDYTVTFDSQGGTAVGDQTVSYGGFVSAPTDPVLNGQTFDGWFMAPTGGSAWNFGLDTVMGPTTLYAQWTPIDYPVTFDSQGGSVVGPQTVAYGSLASAPTDPTFAGHTFDGWFTSASGGSLWNFATSTITGATTLYAQWTPIDYAVTFDSRGGSAVSGETVSFGTHVPNPGVPSFAGHEFEGWFTAPTGGSLWNFGVDTIAGDMTLYAQWETVDYQVTFNSQGGTAVGGQTVSYGDLVTEPSEPTYSGYTFDGWFTAASGGSAWVFTLDTIAGDTTLFAHWTPVDYAVTFDSQGGSAVDGQTVSYGGLASAPADPTLTGYTFLWWHTTPSDGSVWDFATDTVGGDITLYAEWAAIDYSVTFDSQGGSGVSGQTVAYGSHVLAPADPTQTGYAFDGWFTSGVGGSAWDFGSDTVTADTTLYAHWTIDTYPVTFDSQGGSAVGGQTVDYGDYASAPPDPTRYGYTFDGWFDAGVGGSAWVFASHAITGATTIYAQWTPVDWTVTFDSQGGSAVGAESVTHDDFATAPTDPTQTGYTFNGWFTSGSGGSLWDFATTPVIADTTLYAHWTVDTYPVTFDSQGGSAVGGQTVNYGEYASAPPDPTQAGYAFEGWFDSASGGAVWVFASHAITGATTIYAQWTPIVWTVNFDSQGGSAVGGQSVTNGDLATAPADPTQTGYTFDGWFNSAVGGTLWAFASTTVMANTTLYAHWTIDSYPVTFDSQGGTAVGDQTVDYGDHATSPVDPTQAGYTFDGWFTASSGGSLWNFATGTITGATTLYAQWTPIDYTVTFDSQGGTVVAPATVPYSGFVTEPTAPTQTGYTFDGWFTASTGGSAWNFGSDRIVGDATLYAQWTPIDYTVAFDSHGGSAVGSETVAYGGLAYAPTDPTRTGYTFDGWFTLASGGAAFDFATHTITADTTIHAQWSINSYLVAFDEQGGSLVADQTVFYNGHATDPGTPTLTGHTFDGWFTLASGGVAFDFAGTAITGATTIYAQWTPIAYAVTFDTQGGSAVAGQSVNYGGLVTAPADPTQAGYTFSGWYNDPVSGSSWNFGSDTITGATTIYAQWAPIPYTVTFDEHGGSAVLDQTVYYNGHATNPGTPTWTGHTFNGWFTLASGGVAFDFAGTAITGDITVHAQWTIDTHTLSFDSQGGTAVGSQTVDYGDTATAPSPPTQTGFSFDGWFTLASGGTQWNFATDTVTGDATLYAHWTALPPGSHSVTFDSHGGSAVAGEVVVDGNLATDPGAPTQTGYTFNGWFDSASGGAAWDFATHTITADTTIHAQWTVITHAVTFDSHGGSAVAGEVVVDGSLATAPTDPTRTGYTFDGWFTLASGGAVWDFATHTITADTTIHAQWTPIAFTVAFDEQGGSLVADQTVFYNGHATDPGTPTLTGYTFNGWFTLASGGVAFDFAGTAITADTTIHAQWTINSYPVTFDTQGGSAVAGQSVNYGAFATNPGTPTQTGFTFDGWFTLASGGVAFDFAGTAITGATTIYAQWTINSYPVTFDSQGGSAVTGQSVTYGGLVTDPGTPTQAGYTFSGWYNDPVSGSSWNFGSDTITGATTIYAQWAPIPYTVTFDEHGGSAVLDQTVYYNGHATNPGTPTWTGHTFNGWFTLASGGVAFNFAGTAITGDITVHAQWIIDTHILTFDSQGGTAVGPQTVDYGDTATAPSPPTQTGFSFDGWFTLASGGTQWNFATDTVTGDATLYAHWTALPPGSHSVTFDSHGGSAVAGEVVVDGGLATVPTDPTRTGYTFDGWFDAASGGVAWDFATHTITADTTIHAQWTVITHTVTFDSVGGSAVPGQTVNEGGLATTPTNPTRPGYIFGGWFTLAVGGTAWDFATDPVTDETTLFAHWTAAAVVLFDPTGGSAVAGQTIPLGAAATPPAPPSRSGYTFVGWFTAVLGGTQWNFSNAVMADTTLYAQWAAVGGLAGTGADVYSIAGLAALFAAAGAALMAIARRRRREAAE